MTSLADLTTVSFAAGRATVLVVPVGATEQHGPHLPLSTDTVIAVALAGELAARRPGVVVAPAIAFGASGEHQDFAGTISIGRDALAMVIVELVRSASCTFSRVLLLNGHGGNHSTLLDTTARLRREGHDVLLHTPELPGDAHAGWTETSVMLHLQPDLVDLSRAVVGDTRPILETLPILRHHGVRYLSPSGVLGDPRGATAGDGRRIVDAAVVELVTSVDAWTDGVPCSGPTTEAAQRAAT